jgi:hypothetical protein
MKNILFLTIITLAMFSCKKTETNPSNNTNSSTASNAFIDSEVNLMVSDLREVTNTETGSSIKSFDHFLMMDDVFTNKKEQKHKFLQFMKTQGNHIKNLLNEAKSNKMQNNEDGRFDFDSYKGVYNWNNSNGNWDYTAGSNTIEFNFPSDTNGTSNDSKISVSGYTDQMVIFENTYDMGETEYDTTYFPTSLNMSFTVQEEELISMNCIGSFNNDGIPKNINATVFVKPFTFTCKLSKIANHHNVNYSLTKTGAALPIYALDIVATQNNNDEFSMITGSIQFRALEFSGDFNYEDYNNIYDTSNGEATAQELNSTVNIILSNASTSQKLGDIIFAEDDDEYNELFIRYNDGQTQYLYELFEALEDELYIFEEDLSNV